MNPQAIRNTLAVVLVALWVLPAAPAPAYAQFPPMLPYPVTILVLVTISSNRRAIRMNTPACLGRAFVPER